MTIAFTTEEKRAIAVRLIASGKWGASHWTAASQIVHNDCLGLLPDGRLVARPRPKRPVATFLSLGEAAAMAGVHPITIRRWLKAGRLGANPGDRQRPVSRADLEQLLSTRRPGG